MPINVTTLTHSQYFICTFPDSFLKLFSFTCPIVYICMYVCTSLEATLAVDKQKNKVNDHWFF